MKIKYFYLTITLFCSIGLYSQTIPTGYRLKDIPTINGCMIGTMLDNNIYHNNNIGNREFDVITAKWYPGFGGWKGIGQYNFTALNDLVNWNENNGKTTIFHMFVGQDLYLPTWFKNGTYTNSEMDNALKDLIYQTLESNSNKTKIDIINVANELFNNDGTYRNMKWNQLGWEADSSGLSGIEKVNSQHPIFIGKAFQYCKNKSAAKLELREHNISTTNSNYSYYKKHYAIYQLIKHMKAKGYPIDMLSEQAHLTIGSPIFPNFAGCAKRFQELGIEFYISELDIAINQWSNPTAWNNTAATQQRTDYKNFVTACLNAGIKIINVWGTTDNDPTWLPTGYALLFDNNNNPKPAYYGFQDALSQASFMVNSFLINDDSPYVSDTILSIQNSVLNGTPSMYMISESANMGTSWLPYTNQFNYILKNKTQGSHTLYYKVKNSANLESLVVSKKFYYKAPPAKGNPSAPQLIISPSPVSKYATIQMVDFLGSSLQKAADQDYMISFYSVTGQLLKQYQRNSSEFILDLSDLPCGYILVKVQCKDGISSKVILKQ